MQHVKVYPTKPSALNVKHPHGPQMTVGGAMWPKDSFTGRRLTDGSVTDNEAKAWEPEPEAAPAAPAPSTKSSITD